MATANLNQPTSASDGNIPYIGASENDGTGNTLREAINRLNARIKEIYGSQNGSNVVQTPFVDGDNIKDDGVTYAKLEGRFTAADTTITAAADTEIDFDDASVYSFTSAIAVDLRFENEQIGDVKTIIITASGSSSSLTFDTGTNTITKLNGDYDATASAVNFIQVVCTASNTFFVTISQIAS